MDYCFFFKHKTAYEMRISDWSSDVCSSDLLRPGVTAAIARAESLPLSPNRAIVFTALQHYKGNILFRVTSTDSIVMALADRQFAEARRYMVLTQLRPNKVIDENVIAAMAAVPREQFVPKAYRGVAYMDEDVTEAPGRYLLEPMILARLLQEAEIDPQDIALVVGCATGYDVAVQIGRANV